MNDAKYQRKLRKAKRRSQDIRQKQEIRQERNKYRVKKVETSKAIAIYLFMLLNVIVVYALIAMYVLNDLTALGVLISDIAAQVLIYAIYCMKAYKAKKSSESLAFETQKYNDQKERDLIEKTETLDDLMRDDEFLG